MKKLRNLQTCIDQMCTPDEPQPDLTTLSEAGEIAMDFVGVLSSRKREGTMFAVPDPKQQQAEITGEASSAFMLPRPKSQASSSDKIPDEVMNMTDY